jgi:hypothetical protein
VIHVLLSFSADKDVDGRVKPGHDEGRDRGLVGDGNGRGAARNALQFCVHQTIKTTPAKAAGVTMRVWKMDDVVDMIDAWEAREARQIRLAA